MTHHLDLLAGYDRVLVFDRGRIVCDAPPDEAVAHYQALMLAMTPIGLYRPGSSLIHRLPAGVKLLALVLAGIGSVFLRTPSAGDGLARRRGGPVPGGRALPRGALAAGAPAVVGARPARRLPRGRVRVGAGLRGDRGAGRVGAAGRPGHAHDADHRADRRRGTRLPSARLRRRRPGADRAAALAGHPVGAGRGRAGRRRCARPSSRGASACRRARSPSRSSYGRCGTRTRSARRSPRAESTTEPTGGRSCGRNAATSILAP